VGHPAREIRKWKIERGGDGQVARQNTRVEERERQTVKKLKGINVKAIWSQGTGAGLVQEEAV
jgi:hypothetical protein